MRVPSNEMSYMEYTQMYEHTYRNYYSGSINYPVLRQSVSEKAYTYEEQPRYDDAAMKEVTNTDNYSHKDEEMPLNLICAKQRIECKPIEELVRRTDLPLDLSTKSQLYIENKLFAQILYFNTLAYLPQFLLGGHVQKDSIIKNDNMTYIDLTKYVA